MKSNIMIIDDLSKDYHGVQALKNVSFDIKEGEILGLIGENGAGKSTLIKLIAGAIEKSSGSIIFNNNKVSFNNPKSAIDAGIGVVYQEFNLFPNLTVYENIFFGIEIKNKYGYLNRQKMIRKFEQIIKKLGFDFSVRKKVSTLTTAYQQIVEIAKCIQRDVKLLIMDEPSAPLTENEVHKMFHVIKELNKSGVTIVYISHKLDEIIELSNRIAVLRDGEFITMIENENINEDILINHMVGRPLDEIFPEKLFSVEPDKMVVKDLSGGMIKDVSFNLKRGEILGFGGLVGSGRTELMRLIFGADMHSKGMISIDGTDVKIKSPRDAISCGIAFVPEDRKHHGLILNKNILFNASLPTLKSFTKGLKIQYDRVDTEVRKSTDTLLLKSSSLKQLTLHLSGGNQQKVVLSKWLISNSDILILDEPTRGIDVGAKQEIYLLIRELAARGKSIIVVSSEMPELIGLSHRILVMKQGMISGEVFESDMTQENILKLAS